MWKIKNNWIRKVKTPREAADALSHGDSLQVPVEPPKERKYRFDYTHIGGQSESFEVKFYEFKGDFILLKLTDNITTVVLTSKDTVLDRFTIKEIKDELTGTI